MNGRIYDPLLGRFLSADKYIQAPRSLQSYNRYSYVMNNPLTLTDPTGNSWWNPFSWFGPNEDDLNKQKVQPTNTGGQVDPKNPPNKEEPETVDQKMDDFVVTEKVGKSDSGTHWWSYIRLPGIRKTDDSYLHPDYSFHPAREYWADAENLPEKIADHPIAQIVEASLIIAAGPEGAEFDVAAEEAVLTAGTEVGEVEVSEMVPQLVQQAQGKPIMTQWGWQNSAEWRSAADTLARAPNNTTFLKIGGKIPTRAEAESMITARKGTIVRVDPGHPVAGVSTHTYDHINFRTSSGNRVTVQIKSVNE